jgi:ABC-type antimicrobial peptide transport system permease subunit
MRESLWLAAVGTAIGVPVALASQALVVSMLFGLHPYDPLTLVGAVVVLLGMAALAGYLPSRRASQIDPMISLRYQ